MYNYQTFLRDSRLKQKYSEYRKDYIHTSISTQKKMPLMIQSHKKRIEGFILAMVEKPIVIDEYKHRKYQPRESHKSQFLSTNAFYANHHKQSQRIRQLSQQNSVLDQVPFKNTSHHKFREEKILPNQKPLKYTPITSSMRVKQLLEEHPLNILCQDKNKNLETMLKTASASNSSFKAVSKIVNKSLLPNLHQRTYFQSVKTIFSESSCCFLQKPQKQASTNDIYDDQNQIETKKEQQKNNTDDNNRKENSRQALIKCGLLKKLQKDNSKIYNASLLLKKVR